MPDNKKYRGVAMQFTPRELLIFLKKPKCRFCGVVLNRHKLWRDALGKELERKHSPHRIFHDNQLVKYYYYEYSCPKCGGSWTLEQLAKKE